jgi:hypothetical protein
VIPQLAATQFLIHVFAADPLRPAFKDACTSIGEQTAQMNQVIHGPPSM